MQHSSSQISVSKKQGIKVVSVQQGTLLLGQKYILGELLGEGRTS